MQSDPFILPELTFNTCSKKKPNKTILEDIAFAYFISKELNRQDAGQSIVLKKKVVMAVQSAESYKEVINRGCMLSGNKATVVIMSKFFYGNDNIDLLDILQVAVDNKASTIAFEKTSMLDSQIKECIKLANKNKIILIIFTKKIELEKSVKL